MPADNLDDFIARLKEKALNAENPNLAQDLSKINWAVPIKIQRQNISNILGSTANDLADYSSKEEYASKTDFINFCEKTTEILFEAAIFINDNSNPIDLTLFLKKYKPKFLQIKPELELVKDIDEKEKKKILSAIEKCEKFVNNIEKKAKKEAESFLPKKQTLLQKAKILVDMEGKPLRLGLVSSELADIERIFIKNYALIGLQSIGAKLQEGPEYESLKSEAQSILLKIKNLLKVVPQENQEEDKTEILKNIIEQSRNDQHLEENEIISAVNNFIKRKYGQEQQVQVQYTSNIDDIIPKLQNIIYIQHFLNKINNVDDKKQLISLVKTFAQYSKELADKADMPQSDPEILKRAFSILKENAQQILNYKQKYPTSEMFPIIEQVLKELSNAVEESGEAISTDEVLQNQGTSVIVPEGQTKIVSPEESEQAKALRRVKEREWRIKNPESAQRREERYTENIGEEQRKAQKQQSFEKYKRENEALIKISSRERQKIESEAKSWKSIDENSFVEDQTKNILTIIELSSLRNQEVITSILNEPEIEDKKKAIDSIKNMKVKILSKIVNEINNINVKTMLEKHIIKLKNELDSNISKISFFVNFLEKK